MNDIPIDADIYYDGEIFRYRVNGKDATKEVDRRKAYREQERLLEDRWGAFSNQMFDLAELLNNKEINAIEFKVKVKEELNEHIENAKFIKIE